MPIDVFCSHALFWIIADRVLRPLAQEPGSEAALACGESGARVFKLLLDRAEWLGNPADAVRAVTWELVFSLRHEVSELVRDVRPVTFDIGGVTGLIGGVEPCRRRKLSIPLVTPCATFGWAQAVNHAMQL